MTGATQYNVYRSDTPYFAMSNAALAAEHIKDIYWYDYNLNYGKTYYYYVAAVIDANGEDQEEAIAALEDFLTT